MRFCIFLHEEGLLSDRDCVRAMRAVCDRTPPLGRLAIRNRLLTVGQLRELLGMQASSHRPLGRLAVAAGFLTEDQLTELIDQQRRETPTGRDVVVELGMVEAAVAEQAHARFLSVTT